MKFYISKKIIVFARQFCVLNCSECWSVTKIQANNKVSVFWCILRMLKQHLVSDIFITNNSLTNKENIFQIVGKFSYLNRSFFIKLQILNYYNIKLLKYISSAFSFQSCIAPLWRNQLAIMLIYHCSFILSLAETVPLTWSKFSETKVMMVVQEVDFEAQQVTKSFL